MKLFELRDWNNDFMNDEFCKYKKGFFFWIEDRNLLNQMVNNEKSYKGIIIKWEINA